MHADAHFWNGLAEQYAAKPVDNPSAFDRKIEVTKRFLTPDARVLDIGCGTGSLALKLAPHAGELHGLDFSSEMIRIAEAKRDRDGLANVHFHQGTLEEAPFEPGSLDGVMAWSLLHLVRDRQATLEQMFVLARPGGFLVTSTVCLRGQWTPYWAILPIMRAVGKAPWVGMVSGAQLEEEIRAAGFVDLEAPEVGAESTVHFVVARKPA